MTEVRLAFQLPLSGSRVCRRDSATWQSFQLPLSGSPASELLLELWSLLSTPSLGITEPDSGIFRLSAAFCRGTSSHK